MLSSRWLNFSRGITAARFLSTMLALGAVFMFAASAMAGIVVHDTWQDGTDSDPAAPTYSENGTDSDLDTDIESVWFQGGTGTLDPSGPGGPLHADIDATSATSSASYTTYFTPEGSEVELSNAGDALCVKWVFTTGDVVATNTSQNMRIALVDTPGSFVRITEDGTPPGGTYTGYGIFANMAETQGRNDSFEIEERIGTANLLSSSGDWDETLNQTTNTATDNSGYEDDTEYTFLMSITRRANGNLDIEATMTGGNLNNGAGMLTTSTDIAPNGGAYKFDTFALRPSRADSTVSDLYTSLFEVQYKPAVPEPASILMLGLGSLALLMWRRRN